MLTKQVVLHDVRDAEGFVHATINRARLVLTQDEREELAAEGLAILCKLASDFQAHRDGYEQAGRFSGYAAMYLPRKLGDAWHRMHPEHMLVTETTGPDKGKRRWHYKEGAVSLEAITADDPDRHDLLAAKPDESDVRGRLARALDERWERRKQVILDVGDVLAEGGTGADAASVLGLTTGQVQDAVNEIMLVADRFRSAA